MAMVQHGGAIACPGNREVKTPHRCSLGRRPAPDLHIVPLPVTENRLTFLQFDNAVDLCLRVGYLHGHPAFLIENIFPGPAHIFHSMNNDEK